MGKYFGTDGIRGVANAGLGAVLATRAGLAAAIALGETGVKPKAVIGRDTRISGDMLELALTAGLCAGGADVLRLGVLPTPAVAYIARKMRADMGIVISASHNPYEYNGIKIFNNQGMKLSDALETEIERLIDNPEELSKKAKTHDKLGAVCEDDGVGARDYVRRILPLADGDLTSFRVAVDCANGASFETAPWLFRSLGVTADFIGDSPDGTNINRGCGSTCLDALRAMALSGGYDLCIAFDGDADRCLMIDERGGDIDGDMILAVCAKDMADRGRLKNNSVVGTIVSNSGLDAFGRDFGINILRADVGDRNVLELMRASGANLGGETSGHTIFLDEATTGDGQLTAVKFLSIMARTGRAASELVSDFKRFPQVIVNARVAQAEKAAKMVLAELNSAIALAERELGCGGRILVRPSGTESYIRVTVEAETEERARECAAALAALIEKL
ncbi:MAG: phosphoglucosamine mutase [Oscillospiraceae bacterium]|jgi:phosphoglucosamine mutase|nr:phosphoglucosamine mutase [Oscillospiraceae bacterium]